MFRSITRSETLTMQAILIVVFATHIKTFTTRGVDSGMRKRESMDKKTWLGHAALSCDHNARNWKTGRENYLKLKWIVFPFSKFVTLPVLLLIGPLQQIIHVIQNRHTGKQEKQWGKASYICVNVLRLLYHSFRFYASLSSLWYCHFLLVKLCNCYMCCVSKWLLKKDKKEITILNYMSLLIILSQCFGLVLRWWPAAKCPFSTNWLFINVLRVCFDCRFITA